MPARPTRRPIHSTQSARNDAKYIQLLIDYLQYILDGVDRNIAETFSFVVPVTGLQTRSSLNCALRRTNSIQ